MNANIKQPGSKRRIRKTWAVVGTSLILGKSHPHHRLKNVLYFKYQCVTGEDVEQIIAAHSAAFTLNDAVRLAERHQTYWEDKVMELEAEFNILT